MPNSSQHSHLRLQLQARQLPLGRHSLQGGQSILQLALAVQAVGLQWGGGNKIRCLSGCAEGVAVAMRSARVPCKAQTVAVGRPRRKFALQHPGVLRAGCIDTCGPATARTFSKAMSAARGGEDTSLRASS